MMCNPHHLMLFYYVARHGGISQALKKIHYGIQQPALSAQMIALENELEVTLFERRPFSLTRAGQRLYQHVLPFFERLACVIKEMRRPGPPTLRVGSSDLIMRQYLPWVVAALQQNDGEVIVNLECGTTAQLMQAVEEGRLDLAVTGVDRVPETLAVRRLLQLPLVMLVPKQANGRRVPSLQEPGILTEPLIAPGDQEGVGQVFRRGLAERGITWEPTINPGSLSLVSWYVAERRGVGVTLKVPVLTQRPDVRQVPLRGFDPVAIAALWRRPETPVLTKFLQLMEQFGESLAFGEPVKRR